MKWLFVTVAVTAALLFAALDLWPGYTNRFRVTIEVDTPDGIKSGSSVGKQIFLKADAGGRLKRAS
jgi:hypothetical protein